MATTPYCRDWFFFTKKKKNKKKTQSYKCKKTSELTLLFSEQHGFAFFANTYGPPAIFFINVKSVDAFFPTMVHQQHLQREKTI
jgi:hypothetical protein